MSNGNNPVVQREDEARSVRFGRLRANLEDALIVADKLLLAGDITDGERRRLCEKLDGAKQLSDQLFDGDRPVHLYQS